MDVDRHEDDGETDAVDDDHVDWSQVKELRLQIETINAIEDDEERMLAAKEWQRELAGG